MKRKIILNAGHSLSESGAAYHSTTESKEVIKIRDKLTPLLEQSFDVIVVPDDLNLIDSIKWVNERCDDIEDGLAFSIHLNAGGGFGAETLYYGGDENSRKIAQAIIDKYCGLTRFRNRGAKPDSGTRHGRLGWIRDVKPWSCLIECCFIDSLDDLKKLQQEYDEVAMALYVSICKAFNIKPVEEIVQDVDVNQQDKQPNVKTLIQDNAQEIIDLISKL